MLDEPSGTLLHHGFLARGYAELAHREISVERSVPALLALQEVWEDDCVGIDLKYVPSGVPPQGSWCFVAAYFRWARRDMRRQPQEIP